MDKTTYSNTAKVNERIQASGLAALDASAIRSAEFGRNRPVLASSEARALVASRGDAAWSADYCALVVREVFFG